ncbi:MAG: hypothetical protein KAS53_02060 [Candidatus Cloacimonetes bacterium]|nr:hypothetical protein [Candidatus Cloacimonadota bacterium]
MRKVIVVFIVVFVFVSSIYAETIHVITPYLGTINNDMSRTVEGSPIELKLDDSSLFKGLYFQWINPDKYQWNAFVYNSEDLNYSSLWGTHFIFDYYLGVKENSKYVIGAGMEFLTMTTETDEIFPFSNFELSQNIYAPFLRAGKYFYLGDDKIKYSLMPWLGAESDIVRGDIDFTIPPMYPGGSEFIVSDNADDDSFYALAGLNFKVTFYHFIDLKLKYHCKVDLEESDTYDVASGMLNIYFNRNWGISYRTKYMKSAEMENIYHIGGIVYAF